MSERRPEINEKQAAELNLKVLQRIDPQTSEVFQHTGSLNLAFALKIA